MATPEPLMVLVPKVKVNFPYPIMYLRHVTLCLRFFSFKPCSPRPRSHILFLLLQEVFATRGSSIYTINPRVFAVELISGGFWGSNELGVTVRNSLLGDYSWRYLLVEVAILAWSR